MSLSSSGRAVRIHEIAMLGAFALFLATVEYVIPKPVPFMRIGLANLPVMIGLTFLTTREYALLAFLKVFGQGIIHGTLFSYVFLFSLGGSAASVVMMLIAYRLAGRHVTFVGIAVIGAFASNMAQLFLARVFLFGEGAWLIAPPFLITGLITAVVLGLFTQQFVLSSRWLAAKQEGVRRD